MFRFILPAILAVGLTTFASEDSVGKYVARQLIQNADQILAAGDISQETESFLWQHLFPRIASLFSQLSSKANSLDNNVNSLRNDLNQANGKVNDVAKDLSETKNGINGITNQVGNLNSRMASAEGKMAQFEGNARSLLNKITDFVGNFNTRLAEVENKIAKVEVIIKSPVFFDVTNSFSESLKVADGAVVPYTNFIAKGGDMKFDPSTGTFVASKAGTYKFTFSAYLWDDSSNNGPACVSLQRNERELANSCAPDYAFIRLFLNRESLSISVITRVECDDRIRVVATSSDLVFLSQRSLHFVGNSIALD
jgi:ABC-type transporter Mla subunit MlaD